MLEDVVVLNLLEAGSASGWEEVDCLAEIENSHHRKQSRMTLENKPIYVYSYDYRLSRPSSRALPKEPHTMRHAASGSRVGAEQAGIK